MSNSRLLSQIQHAIQYPSGHLDRFASFGPAFETDSPGGQPNDRKPTESPMMQPDQPVETTDQVNEIQLADPKKFILAGDATFTLQGLNTRYTFNCRESEPGSAGSTVTFISMLTGPDNGSDYTYVGLLDRISGQIRLTRKSRLTAESGPVRAFNWAMRRIWTGREVTPARILFASRCGRCGRTLTVTGSIVAGFGPECLAKMNGGE